MKMGQPGRSTKFWESDSSFAPVGTPPNDTVNNITQVSHIRSLTHAPEIGVINSTPRLC